MVLQTVLTYFLIAMAAVMNAVMDVITHRFYGSVFDKWYLFNNSFWDARTSWANKYIDGDPDKGRKKFLGLNLHPAFTDGWHLCKSLMIIFLCLAIVISPGMNIAHFICLGLTWNVSFGLFYKSL